MGPASATAVVREPDKPVISDRHRTIVPTTMYTPTPRDLTGFLVSVPTRISRATIEQAVTHVVRRKSKLVQCPSTAIELLGDERYREVAEDALEQGGDFPVAFAQHMAKALRFGRNDHVSNFLDLAGWRDMEQVRELVRTSRRTAPIPMVPVRSFGRTRTIRRVVYSCTWRRSTKEIRIRRVTASWVPRTRWASRRFWTFFEIRVDRPRTRVCQRR
jgi:hypothetical protein